ncbi:UDP-glucose flavonoid 3-O-glucosyltransferase 6 [Linum grandiflorum]
MKNTSSASAELVFVTSPGPGHIFPAVQLAEQLVNQDPRVSVTVCHMTMPQDDNSKYLDPTAHESSRRIRFIELQTLFHNNKYSNPHQAFFSFIASHGSQMKQIISTIMKNQQSRHVAVVLDLLCTTYIDVAKELGVPCYVLYTTGATFLSFMFHIQSLFDSGKLDLINLDELEIPSLTNPLPCNLVRSLVVDPVAVMSPVMLDLTRRARESKGILVNSFDGLEPHAIRSLDGMAKTPPIYTVGPILELKRKGDEMTMMMEWLDKQPPSSVVYLCFGSWGRFDDDRQVQEIAFGLELSGQRFLWSLRTKSNDSDGVLPDGFLERTKARGKVVGWTPQERVLAHESVGGFVTHCGWNSILESVWFGVPVGALPMDGADQKLNAFLLVKEIGVGEEIRMGGSGEIVSREEIDSGIRRLMISDDDGGVKKKKKMDKLKVLSDECKMAVIEGGPSYQSLGRFIENVFN